ncbi:hypothetical protein BDQ17DRAFT_1095012 [Cyathus striatus]|nr:hypothetical protein BDQ17DRAFT_1095012 [Cyathus striatus]
MVSYRRHLSSRRTSTAIKSFHYIEPVTRSFEHLIDSEVVMADVRSFLTIILPLDRLLSFHILFQRMSRQWPEYHHALQNVWQTLVLTPLLDVETSAPKATTNLEVQPRQPMMRNVKPSSSGQNIIKPSILLRVEGRLNAFWTNMCLLMHLRFQPLQGW